MAKAKRDLTAAQFFAACDRHGIRFSMWQGRAFVGAPGSQRLICYTAAGVTRRAWLARLLEAEEAAAA